MENKKQRIEFRITQEEKKKLIKNSKDCGIHLSEYIREMLFKKDPQFLSIENRNELNELRKEVLILIKIGNLYHEQRTQNQSVVSKAKSFLKRFL
jgi:hypothetical protein